MPKSQLRELLGRNVLRKTVHQKLKEAGLLPPPNVCFKSLSGIEARSKYSLKYFSWPGIFLKYNFTSDEWWDQKLLRGQLDSLYL